MVSKKLLKHISKLEKSRTKLYRDDAEGMKLVLACLKKKKYKQAQNIYWKMDTSPRDDFSELYTDDHKNKKSMDELSKKLKIEWNITKEMKTDKEYYEDMEISPQRELAIEILDEFDELLEGYDLTIPDKEREVVDKRTGEESRIYGSNYWFLEDKFTNMIEGILKKK